MNASVSRNSPCIQSNAQSRSGCQKPRAEPPAGEQDGSQGPRGAHSAEGTPRDTTAGTAQQIRPRGGVCETPTRFVRCHGEQTGPAPPPAAQTATQTSDEPGFSVTPGADVGKATKNTPCVTQHGHGRWQRVAWRKQKHNLENSCISPAPSA